MRGNDEVLGPDYGLLASPVEGLRYGPKTYRRVAERRRGGYNS